MDEETEAEKGEMPCPKSGSWQVTESGFELAIATAPHGPTESERLLLGTSLNLYLESLRVV